MTNLLNRNLLLTKEKLEVKKVELDATQHVFVRQMTGKERDQYEKLLVVEKKDENGNVIDFEKNLENFRAKTAVMTVCDEEGHLILKPEDAEMLSECMSADKLDKIVKASQNLNSIDEASKALLLKNSDAVQIDNSNSGSVEN